MLNKLATGDRRARPTISKPDFVIRASNSISQLASPHRWRVLQQ